MAEYDEDRISFKNGDDAIIFDEAWEHFGSSPPEKLKIVVADGPGEKEKRESTVPISRPKLTIQEISGITSSHILCLVVSVP